MCVPIANKYFSWQTYLNTSPFNGNKTKYTPNKMCKLNMSLVGEISHSRIKFLKYQHNDIGNCKLFMFNTAVIDLDTVFSVCP